MSALNGHVDWILHVKPLTFYSIYAIKQPRSIQGDDLMMTDKSTGLGAILCSFQIIPSLLLDV